jgi:uncharacterized protein YecE (DUF72 family)
MLLDRFLEAFPDTVPLAVEVRHPSFFEPTPSADDYFQMLTDHRVSTVITDVAGRRDVCHMRLTARNVLIRFVGNGLHPTDYTRIQAWAGRIKQWTSAGLHSVYFFTHEPDNLLAPELAAYGVETFRKQMPDVPMRGPVKIEPPGGTQGSLF